MTQKKPDLQSVLDDINSIAESFSKDLTETTNSEQIQKLKTDYTGRKSKLNNLLKDLVNFQEEERKILGSKGNELKVKISQQLADKEKEILKSKHVKIDENDKIDITLPIYDPKRGHLHPITQMMWKTEDIFQKMGFDIVYPFEVDDDFHNFTSLNLPEGHPARDSWDTFWTEDGHIAITHTSSMQNRVLKTFELPIRVVVPGKCFRNEATDARHEHTFHQVEGIYVDKGITLNNMLGTLQTFFTAFFENEIEVKFTPDYFPFVEPGGMVSLTCILCDGKGCNVCKETGWLEVLGCGMIHPKVLEMGGVDPEVYTGFAWGFGLERLVMLKYNIEDVRNFHSGKFDFLNQF
jgi:phenylalanyl-tRNA synthetase alpha chain